MVNSHHARASIQQSLINKMVYVAEKVSLFSLERETLNFNFMTPIRRIFIFIGSIVLLPNTVLATQGHGGIEGVYVHQLAHLFFILSMGILIYWLRERKLVVEVGWRYIQYAALFFILWNIDTVLVHALDDQFRIVEVQRIGRWQIQIADHYDSALLRSFYYLAKLDHLLCVPALIFLYLGLKRLLTTTPVKMENG